MRMALLRVVQRIVSRYGFSVIPLVNGTKRPAIAWTEYQHRRPTGRELVTWFGDGRRAAYAIVAGAFSGFVVIDVDGEAGERWATTHLPPTPMRVRTRRGEHWYYRHPGSPVRNKAHIRTADGQLPLDVRGDGGFVVGPGSLHPEGHRYVAPDPWPSSLDAVPVFDTTWIATPEPKPSRIPRTTRSMAPALERARRYLAAVPPAIQGQGGDTHTFQLACRLLRGFALPDHDAFRLLTEWNRTCQPPWSEQELLGKLRSAAQHGYEPIGGRL